MDIFDFMTMLGGLSLFLFGMSLMGSALERRAGSRLRSLLDQMTGKPLVGFLTGLGVTAIIQSSSATTVMVVGFVNSGLMTLRQAINVIMGAVSMQSSSPASPCGQTALPQWSCW